MKNIIITGCSSGIGLESAILLKKQGYLVFPTARDPGALNHLRNMGFSAVYLDFNKRETIQKAALEIRNLSNGKIDVLINNAGFAMPGAVSDLSRDNLQEQFDTNFFGLHEFTMAFYPLMKAQKSGLIINISSILGLVSFPFRGAYNASKYALEGLSDALRLEAAKDNIDICLIEPGPIQTAFRENAKKQFFKNIDLKNSDHKKNYAGLNANLENQIFSLKPIEVAKKIQKIIKSKKRKARYPITLSAYLLIFLKRLLTTKMLDKIIRFICRKEF